MRSVPAGDLKRLLLQHGFSTENAEWWSKFVQHSLNIFQAAAKELRKDENWKNFKKMRGALSKPRARKGSKKFERVPFEDAITSELGKLLRRFRREVPRNHFLNFNQVAFESEYLVPDRIRAGKYSKKSDFCVYAQFGKNPRELVIEAKPLVKEADITTRYLGKEGIGCFFTTDSPYTKGPLGGMLAYTINQDGKSWRAEIQEAVRNYQPPPLLVSETLIEGEPEPLTFSRHKRTALELDPIAILHIEMIFSPDIQEITDTNPPSPSSLTS